jgi:thiamine pyrophosphate-dependent acetolactate synthase large subunit-like protein
VHGTRPKAAKADLEAAAKLIDGAQRPLLLVGGGTVDCAPAVRAFLEKSGALGVSSTAGKGVIPTSHPQNIGSPLLTKPMQEYLASADVVIAAGTELAETDSWVDRLTIPGKLIRIDLDAFTLTRDYPPAVGLLADAGEALTALTGLIKAGRKPDITRAAQIREAIKANLTPLERKHVKVLGALRDALPKNGMVATDMTQIAYTANYNFPCEEPRCFFHPCGFGTLGYAMPAAIGAKIACPDAEVWVVVGDGGFQMTMPELATLVQEQLDINIAIINNGYLGMVRQWQEFFYDKRYAATPITGPNFAKLADAFGIAATTVTRRAEVEGAVEAARRLKRAALIDFQVEQEDSVYPMVPAGADLHKMIRRPSPIVETAAD